jgi:hypothetical protein
VGQETDKLRFYINLLAGQQEYSSRQAGITAGIVLAVLVPILLGLVCVAYQLLVRNKKESKYKVRDISPVRQVQHLIQSCLPSVVLDFYRHFKKPANGVLCDVVHGHSLLSKCHAVSQTVSLEFFIDIIFPAALWPQG